MNKRRLKVFLNNIIAIFLMFALAVPAIANDNQKSDTNEHWAQSYINNLSNQGIMKGEKGKFFPDRPITRAEFAQLAVKTFNYEKTGTVSFKDVPTDAWYAASIAKAATQGFMQGYKDKAEPEALLSREDAAVMLAKILKLNGGGDISCPDAEKISDYAKQSVSALWAKGYLKGDEKGRFNPQASLTRAETARLISVVAGKIYGEKREYNLYNQPITGNATISVAGATLKNTVINGDLYITEGVGNGEVTLENVEVKGETIVSGGGMDSIVLINTKTGRLKVEVPDGIPVRIVASGDSTIGMVTANSESKFQENGLTGSGFGEMVISVPANAKVTLDGDFDSVVMDSPNARLDVWNGTIGNVTVSKDAANADINIASTATVTDLKCEAPANIGGTGNVGSASIEVNGVTMAQKPGDLTLGSDVSATINNSKVESSTASGGGGGGGGGGSSGGGGGSSSTKLLNYNHIEVEYAENSTVIRMVFNEPIEVIAGGANISSTLLRGGFTYSDGSATVNIPAATLQNKALEFYIPKAINAGTQKILLSSNLIGKNFTIRGTTSNAILRDVNGNVLQFEITDKNNNNFTITGPTDVSVVAGETVQFNVNVTGATSRLKYQWYRNGNAISGATSSSYSFASGINHDGTKYHVVVSQIDSKIWTSKISQTAILSVSIGETETVFLEPGSKGIAGDRRITGLTVGSRYYVTTDSQTYPLLANGTLGKAGDHTTFDNLQPQTGTVITGLNNGQWYNVVRVTKNMPTLKGMIIGGTTEDINFSGYVPPMVEIKANPSQTTLKLEVTPNEGAEVTVYSKKTLEEEGIICTPTNGVYTVNMTAARMTEYVDIVLVPEGEPQDTEDKAIYRIEVTKNSTLAIQGIESLFLDELRDVTYRVMYKEPSQKLQVFKYGDTLWTEGKDYTQTINADGNIEITVPKSFLVGLNMTDNTDLTFNFEFLNANETVTTKVCTLQIIKPEHLTMGKMEFLETESKNYLEIYVPLLLNGKEPVSYDTVKNKIRFDNYGYNESKLTFFNDNTYINYILITDSNVSNIDEETKKGMVVRIPSLNTNIQSLKSWLTDMPNGCQLNINAYNSKKHGYETIKTETLSIAQTTTTNATIEFTDATVSPAFNKDEHTYDVTITDEATFAYKMKADNEYFCYLDVAGELLEDENYQKHTLSYLVAQKNTMPTIYTFTYKKKFTKLQLLEIGEPELLSADVLSAESIDAKYLNVYVPLLQDNLPVQFDDVKGRITYSNLNCFYDTNYCTPVNINTTERKGLILQLDNLNSINLSQLRSWALSPKNTASVSIGLTNTNGVSREEKSFEIPQAVDTGGNIEFTKATSTPEFLSTVKDYALTINDIDFTHKFNNTAKEYSRDLLFSGKYTMDDNGKDVKVYDGFSPKPHLVYLVAQQNTMPTMYSYEFKDGKAVADGSFIITYGAIANSPTTDKSTYNFLPFYGPKNATTIAEMKEKHLDFDNTTYSISSRDGSPVTKKLSELEEGGYLKENGNSVSLQFENVVNLFKAFDINPTTDEIKNVVSVTSKLTGASTEYHPKSSDICLDQTLGKVTALKVKDKGGNNTQPVDLQNGQNNYDITVPYTEASFEATTSAGYEFVVYDSEGLPIDLNQGIILDGNGTDISIVIARGNTAINVYKFNLKYSPDEQQSAKRSRGAISDEAIVTFEHYFDDAPPSEEEEEQGLFEEITVPEEAITPPEPVVPEEDDSVTDEPIVPEDDDSVTDETIVPKDEDSVTDETIVPEDEDSVTDETIVPEDDDIVADEPIVPEEDNNVADEPIVPEEDDNATDKPIVPEEDNNVADEPIVPEEDDIVTDEPIVPEEDDNVTDEPIVPEDEDSVTDETIVPEDEDSVTDEPFIPEDEDTDVDNSELDGYLSRLILKDADSDEITILDLQDATQKLDITIPYENAVLLFEDSEFEIFDETDEIITEDEIRINPNSPTTIRVVFSSEQSNGDIIEITYTFIFTQETKTYVSFGTADSSEDYSEADIIKIIDAKDEDADDANNNA